MTSVEKIYERRCRIPSDINGHLSFMHDLVVDVNAQTVVECGVRSGNSTSALLAAVEKTGGHLWSVDVDNPTIPDAFYGPSWTLVVADNLTVADQLPERIDVLFIDTAHTLRHTRAELALYGPRASVILLHDTELTGEWYQKGDPDYPVRVAIDEYVAATGRSVEYRPGWYGLGVVR